MALAAIRPPTPAVLDYWDRYSQPEDGYGNYTVLAIGENRSPDGFRLLQAKLVDPEHPADDRVGWISMSLVPNRHEPIVLDVFGNALAVPDLDPAVYSALLEGLFDEQLDQWFDDNSMLSRHEEAPPEILERLAELGRKLTTDPRTTEEQRRSIMGSYPIRREEDERAKCHSIK